MGDFHSSRLLPSFQHFYGEKDDLFRGGGGRGHGFLRRWRGASFGAATSEAAFAGSECRDRLADDYGAASADDEEDQEVLE
jgi:hypothetical protein